jgi:hypothetical protein
MVSNIQVEQFISHRKIRSRSLRYRSNCLAPRDPRPPAGGLEIPVNLVRGSVAARNTWFCPILRRRTALAMWIENRKDQRAIIGIEIIGSRVVKDS